MIDLHGTGGVERFSCVWAMVARDTPGYWVQTGYLCDGTHPNVHHKFAQWKSDSGVTKELGNADPPGSGSHRYEVYYDGTKWLFRYDGITWGDSLAYGVAYNPTWLGGNVQFSGEVAPDKTVQMMGDSANHVRFSGMQEYKPGGCGGGGWTTVWPETYRNDDPTQWGQLVSQANGYFEIYDTNK